MKYYRPGKNYYGVGLFEGLEELFRPMWEGAAGGILQTDIKEEGDNCVLEIELPGVEKENITVTLEDATLTVQATRPAEKEDEKTYLRRERGTGIASRAYHVGKYLKEEDISASYENGVLKLTFPKEEVRTAAVKKSIRIA